MANKNDHTKYYNIDGIEVPSVTTVLKILNKPYLLKWANAMGFKRKNIKDILEETGEIGSIVHRKIEADLNNKRIVFMKTKNYKFYIDNAFNSYLDWKNDYPILQVYANELSLSSDKFGGTLDLLAKVYLGEKLKNCDMIIDFKTSSGIHPTMFLQLAGYFKLLKLTPQHNYNLDRVGIVRFPKEYSNYEFVHIPIDYLNDYIKLFDMLVDVYSNWVYLLKHDWNEEFDS